LRSGSVTSILERALDIGSRSDPHAQERAARSGPVLLHSLSLFREVFEEIFARRSIRTVVEVGVETGQVSGVYADLGASRVYCVDPFPSAELRAALAQDDRLELVEKFSPQALGELPVADLYVIDGDHNYATVRGEVDWILQNAPDAVVVFHDLMWPCGRRDFYYQPTALSEADRHPDSEDGPTVWHDGLTPAGFIGAGAFTFAREAGGERNGVLTAVEDALAAAPDPDWQLEIIPAIFGVGVLMRRTGETAELLEVVRRYSGFRLLAAMENNRLALYTRVLQMQFEAVAAATEADRLAQVIASQRLEIDELHQKTHELTEQLSVSVAARETVLAEAEEARRRRPAARLRRLAGRQVRRVSTLLPTR
jgi:hypothetical protein